ncbi:MAG: hypothetical protein ACR2N6_06130 [Miltoncostaeaceae bacterium]
MHFGLVKDGEEIDGPGYGRVPLASCGWRDNAGGERSLFVTWPEAEEDWQANGVGFFANLTGGGPFFVWPFCDPWESVTVPAGSHLTLGLPPGAAPG